MQNKAGFPQLKDICTYRLLFIIAAKYSIVVSIHLFAIFCSAHILIYDFHRIEIDAKEFISQFKPEMNPILSYTVPLPLDIIFSHWWLIAGFLCFYCCFIWESFGGFVMYYGFYRDCVLLLYEKVKSDLKIKFL